MLFAVGSSLRFCQVLRLFTRCSNHCEGGGLVLYSEGYCAKRFQIERTMLKDIDSDQVSALYGYYASDAARRALRRHVLGSRSSVCHMSGPTLRDIGLVAQDESGNCSNIHGT